MHLITTDSFINEKELGGGGGGGMGTFLPIPKKGIQRHIFAIVHGRMKQKRL